MRVLRNALSTVALCLICFAVMSADCADDPNETESLSVALECSPLGLNPPLGGFVSGFPSALEFGETFVGSSVEDTILARNPDAGSCYYATGGCEEEGVYGAVVEVTGFTAVNCGPGENPFAVTGLPTVLNPLESTRLMVRFAPEVTGEWACRLEPEWGVLSTEHSADGGFAHNCYISARGSAIAAPEPVCALDPPSAAFQYGSVEVGSSSDLTLTIRNETTYPVTTNRFRYVLENPVAQCGMFTIAPADTAGVLGPGESKDLLVRFRPDAAGDFECTRSLASLKEPADLADPSIASACPVTVTWRGTGRLGAPVWSSCAPGGNHDFHGVSGLAGSEVYVAGRDGVVLASGGECQWLVSGTAFDSVDLTDIWAYASGGEKAIWAVGNIATSPPTGVILRSNGAQWSNPDQGWLVSYGAVWGSGLDDVYFAGLGVATDFPNAKHWNGSVFDTLHVSEMGMSPATGVSGTASNDIWVVLGQSWNPVFRFQGGQWTSQNQAFMTKPLYDVWAVQGSDFYAVYAVGGDGAIYHYDGSQWTDESIAGETRDFYGVWVSGTGQVFVVGEGHVIYHYDGNTWSQQTVANLEGDLMDVWGASDDDVYAVGTNGLILRYAPIGG